MRSQPLFSVITVCLNDKPKLFRTADSIVTQTFDDWEWIVVDGGSSDGTIEYLDSLKIPTLRWVSEPDDGIFAAFNKGNDLASGRYRVFISTGDRFCEPKTLEKVATFITDNPDKDIYYADAYEVDEQYNRFLRPARDHDKIWWNMFTHHEAIFFANSCYDNLRYNENCKIGGDYEFVSELLHSGATAAKIPFSTVEFLLGGTSQQNYWKGEAENWATRTKLGVPMIRRVAIYLAKSIIRWGRIATPALYRLLRYAPARASG